MWSKPIQICQTPCLHVVGELAPARRRGQLQRLAAARRARRSRCWSRAPCVELQQTLVLGIDVEEQAVVDVSVATAPGRRAVKRSTA